MASPKTWTVVHFFEDNSVEAVPTQWINGTRCLWPLLPPEKLSTAIRKQEFNTHWPDSSVRVLRNATFSDYATARAKAKKAEDFSDLNSTSDADEDEQTVTKKERRRIQKKKIFSSDEENSSDKEPIIKKSKLIKPLPPPPSWDEAAEELVVSNIEERTGKEPALKSGIGLTEPLMSPKTPNESNQENTPKTISKKCIGKEPTPKKSATGNATCACSSSAILFNIQNILVDIKATVDSLAGKVAINPEAPKVDILKKSKICLPIGSEEDLDSMERFLSEEENYAALVSFFSKMGGHNLYEFIKRCLRPLLSDDVAINFSFIGRKGKKRFDTLALSKAIIESAELAKIAKNKKESELNISIWLRKATERKARSAAKVMPK